MDQTGASVPPIFDELTTRGYRRILEQLGEDAFTSARDEGRRLPIHEVTRQ
jgi:hypothetical protein